MYFFFFFFYTILHSVHQTADIYACGPVTHFSTVSRHLQEGHLGQHHHTVTETGRVGDFILEGCKAASGCLIPTAEAQRASLSSNHSLDLTIN